MMTPGNLELYNGHLGSAFLTALTFSGCLVAIVGGICLTRLMLAATRAKVREIRL